MSQVTGTSQVKAKLKRWSERTEASLLIFADHFGKGTLERYAKANATWTDRTNLARNGLHGGGFKSQYDIISFVAHNVNYGIYLEKSNAGKYAILLPTIQRNKKDFKKGVERIVNR